MISKFRLFHFGGVFLFAVCSLWPARGRRSGCYWTTTCATSSGTNTVDAISSSHIDHSSHRHRTVHDRLSHALNYHEEFLNVTLPTRTRTRTRIPPVRLIQNNSTKPSSPISTTTTSVRRKQSESSESLSSNVVPLTLNQARIIHQLALEATHGVQRSHGHIIGGSSAAGGEDHSSCRPGRPSSPRLFLPVDYGADPTGVQDSTEAFARLMHDFLSSSSSSSSSRPLAANITNLGGATLDLQGGTYLLSQPIVIPPMYGNAHIIDGTLQASSSSFPSDRWLLEIGNADTCHPVLPDGHTHDPQYSCNEFIDVTRVLLDANFVAAGGVQVSRVMGTTLDEVFVTGFVQVGILIQFGHEVMISNAWLGECYWSTNQWCQDHHSQSVGIRINGMDHYLNNIIVFDFAKVGVEIWQPANLLEGVHTWNGGGHGIVVGQDANRTTHSVRLVGCYLDFETLDLWDPVNVLVESTFFYYGHVVLHAGAQASIDGLTLRFNHYNTNQSVVLDGTFDKIRSVSIQDELDWVKTTKASRRLSLSNATEWTFEFRDPLLFPSIDHISYSLASSSTSVVSHFARPPNGTSVTVVTSEPIDATVYMTVEQGNNY